jgi:hypothetical protein
MSMSMSPGDELPAALAAIPLDRLEALEQESGRSFGELIAELTAGTWSIATMRQLVGLVDPDADVATLGDLIEAASALNPKATGAPAQ